MLTLTCLFGLVCSPAHCFIGSDQWPVQPLHAWPLSLAPLNGKFKSLGYPTNSQSKCYVTPVGGVTVQDQYKGCPVNAQCLPAASKLQQPPTAGSHHSLLLNQLLMRDMPPPMGDWRRCHCMGLATTISHWRRHSYEVLTHHEKHRSPM